MTPHETHSHHSIEAAVLETSVKDPVCGMAVDPHTAEHRHTYEGRPYYFCSGKCREKFISEPSKYLKPEAHSAAPLLLSPIIAAAAMALSSVSVIGNALRFNRVKL